MWQTCLLAADAAPINRFWFLLPLIVIVSVVYSASRYESPGRIFVGRPSCVCKSPVSWRWCWWCWRYCRWDCSIRSPPSGGNSPASDRLLTDAG